MKLCLYFSLLVCLSAIFKWESNLIRDCMFCFATRCDWSRKLAPSCQPIRCKSENNRDLVTRVFPRFKQFVYTLSYYGNTACVFVGHAFDHCLCLLRSPWPSPHPTYRRALTQLFEMCCWGVLNQSKTRDHLLRNSLDIHSLLKCERKLATSYSFFFFLLKFSQLELLNRALSFVHAAHSNISPTCGRVVSLDPESVRIFPKVKTLCVMSAYLKVELDPGICDRGVRSLILKT